MRIEKILYSFIWFVSLSSWIPIVYILGIEETLPLEFKVISLLISLIGMNINLKFFLDSLRWR